MADVARHETEKYIKEHKKEHNKKKRWYQIVTALAAVAVFCTTYALIIPAITWSRTLICELPEHTHTDACYELSESGERVLTCVLEEHTHSDACFDAPPAKDDGYICGKVAHKHSAEQHCYFPDGTLRCTLPEHEHTSACVEQKQPEAKKADAVAQLDDSEEVAAKNSDLMLPMSSDDGEDNEPNDDGGTGTEYDLASYPLNATLWVNGVELQDGTIISDDDSFQFRLKWNLPDGEKYLPNDTFIYTTDALLVLSEVNDGIIYSEDGKTKLGTYSANGNKITVQYTNEEFMQSLQYRYTSLVFSGKFDVDQITDPDVGEYTISIPGDTDYNVYIRTKNGLGIVKTATKNVDQTNHKVYVDYRIELTSLIDNTNVHLKDSFSFNNDGVAVQATITDQTATMYRATEGASELTEDSTFSLNDFHDGTVKPGVTDLLSDEKIGDMKKGDKLVITYRVESPLTGNDDRTLYNTATAESDQSYPVEGKTTTPVRRVAIYKNGEISDDETKIKWNITVFPGEFKTITVRDSDLGDTMSCDNNTTVEIYSGYGTTMVDSTTWGKLHGSSGYVLDVSKLVNDDRFFILRFETKIGKSPAEHRNTAEIKNPAQVTTATVSNKKEPQSSKELRSAEFFQKEGDTSTYIRIESDITVDFNGMEVDKGYSYISDTSSAPSRHVQSQLIRVTDENYNEYDGDGKPFIDRFSFTKQSESRSRIGLNEGFQDGKYHFIVETVYKVDYLLEADNLKNTAKVHIETVDGDTFEREGEWEREVTSGYISKTCSRIQDDKVTWCIQSGDLKLDTTFYDLTEDYSEHSYLVEKLPAGLEFVAAAWGNPEPENATTVERATILSQTGTAETGITLTFKPRANSQLYILTKYAGDYTKLEKPVSYTNSAYIEKRTSDDDSEPGINLGTVTADTEITPPVVVDKGFKYDETTAPFVYYTINVNQSALDLIPAELGGQTVTDQTFYVKDDMGSALLFDEDSLLINDEPLSNYEGMSLTVDSDGRGFQLNGLKDATSYKITYRARITLQVGAELTKENASNDVKIPDIYIPASNKTHTEIIGKVQYHSGYGGGETFAFRIHKVDDQMKDGQPNPQPVKGVRFELLKFEGVESDEGIKPSGEGEHVEFIETNEGGWTPLLTNLTVGQIYGIREIYTPKPWLDESKGAIIYFVRPHRTDDGEATEEYSKEVRNLKDYDTYEFTIENRHLSNCELTLKKFVDGIDLSTIENEEFHFTVRYTDPWSKEDVTKVTYELWKDGESIGKFEGEEKVILKANESAKLLIPESSVVTITEVNHPGYTVTMDVSSGKKSNGDSVEFELYNEDAVTVTITNNAGVELPSTGGAGIHFLYMLGVLLIAGALVYGYSVRRKREGRNK